DLRRSERMDLGATRAQRSNDFTLLTKGNYQERARDSAGAQRWKIVLGADVGDGKRAMLSHPAKLWRINTELFAANRYGYGTKMCPRSHSVLVAESQHHVIDPTNPRRAL